MCGFNGCLCSTSKFNYFRALNRSSQSEFLLCYVLDAELLQVVSPRPHSVNGSDSTMECTSPLVERWCDGM